MTVHNTDDQFSIRTTGLTKRFGGFAAVDNVSISLRPNVIHALIGPNGAGKTTLFNMLVGFVPPTSGTVFYNGRDVTKIPPAKIAKLGLVRSFQISAVFQKMTVIENVKLALHLRENHAFDFWRSDKTFGDIDKEAQEILVAVGLERFTNTLVEELSYGRKRALEIGTTLALRPNMMLLDEPTSGLGTEDIDRVTELIRSLSKNCNIVLVEHNLSVVKNLCDNVIVLQRGRVIAEGTYDDVFNNAEVATAYLGSGHA